MFFLYVFQFFYGRPHVVWAGHYILPLWILLLFPFFIASYSQRSQIGCLPYFHPCLSATCGSLKIQDAKIRHLRTIAQLRRAIS